MMHKRGCILWLLAVGVMLGCSSEIPPDQPRPDLPRVANAYKASPAEPERELKPWDNKLLWKGFTETQSHASFQTKIHKSLPIFNFKIVGAFRKPDQFLPSHIEITNASSAALIQRLDAKEYFDNHGHGYSKISLPLADLVQLIDLNGDGYLDLRLLYETGATGNNWHATYLFNPKQKKFKFHLELSMLSAVTQDPDTKGIKTYWRSGWCSEFREYFKVTKGGKLILIRVEWSEMKVSVEDGRQCFKLTGVPHDGNTPYLGYSFYGMDELKFSSFVRKKVKVIKKDILEGSLDERRRGPAGIPLR